ncbi:LacI family DNA-binding transcriptional regulator [Conservatibacter flavescens]|uniref:LacI family transcriptional regulator n=1 Tax=Conservatibacter flavescens TaxID=28161 RepID=A0A2M8S287_9PAST|nr:LacI family DNA-binding transcriptional regulator [Conservatibacter flavescens]PJG85218.1 LacI family transcriptional regulator [Conservatibacter flavescens]
MTLTKKATISDVAKLAKVGKTSVSRYLNGEFKVLSEDIQRRIKLAIETLDYKPSRLASGMKKGRTKLIALVFADLSISYAMEIMRGVETACRENDYTLLVFNANNESEQEKKILQLLTSYQVEGVIIQALRTHDHNFYDFNLPMVSIDRAIHGCETDLVHLDNIQATKLAVTHLIENAFEQVLFITEKIEDIQARQQRSETFYQLMQSYPQCKGEIIEVLDISQPQQIDPILQAFYQSGQGKKQAILAVNGVATLNTALALKRLNIEWGRDIGLIGFDDPNWAAVLGDGITTIRQPTLDIGYCAFELLLKRIQGDRSKFKTVLYPGELIVRKSTIL